MDNLAIITRGFQILRNVMASYLKRELSYKFGNDKWQREGVLNVLYENQKLNLPKDGDCSDLMNSLDVAICLLLLEIHWPKVFKKNYQ